MFANDGFKIRGWDETGLNVGSTRRFGGSIGTLVLTILCRIVYLLVIAGVVHCIVEPWQALFFDRHRFAYKVVKVEPVKLGVQDLEHLANPRPLNLKNSQTKDDIAYY